MCSFEPEPGLRRKFSLRVRPETPGGAELGF